MKEYRVRQSILNIPLDMWNKIHDKFGDGDYVGTVENFLTEIGLPSSLSARTNDEEKEFIERIYELERNRSYSHD